MAILVWDGFDHYNSPASDLGQRSGFLQYTLGAGSAFNSFVTGSNGIGKALRLESDIMMTFGQRVASAFVGFRQRFQHDSGMEYQFYDTVGDLAQVSVVFNQINYSVAVYRGKSSTGTLLYLTANNVWTDNIWSFVEIWPVIDNAAGSVLVKIAGVTVVNISGVDTQNSANAWWDQIRTLGRSNTGIQDIVDIDDLYYGDTSVDPGLVPGTSPIGDSKTYTLFTVGNSSVQFTPLTGTNWGEVSEVAMDSDTSYNFSSTVGNEDLLNFGPLPLATTTQIFGIQLTGAYRKDDSGTRSVQQSLTSGGTAVHSADHALSGTAYAYFTDRWILDPNTTLNWTTTAVNALSGGYKVSA